MKRVLIVSPHFPPTNAPDHQRVRMALPYFGAYGWEPEVIAVDPDQVFAPVDPFLAGTVPKEVLVQRVRGVPRGCHVLPGFGSLAHRVYFALRRAVLRRLDERSCADQTLVYFSTTQFPVHRMIPDLKRQFRVGIVVDYQDPWVNDYYDRHPTIVPPGGRLKYAVARGLARRQERRVLPFVDGITAVSDQYRHDLTARYRDLHDVPFRVLPFGAPEADFAALTADTVRQSQFDPGDGRQHWVYVGRGGADMARALRGFFRAFRSARQAGTALNTVCLHFIGTDYSAPGRGCPTIAPLAASYGLSDLVHECTIRIPYGEALRCLQDAQALIVPGSDDPGYTASKIYPYVLARKPMLTIFHEHSSVNEFVRSTECGAAVTFTGNSTEEELAQAIEQAWFAREVWRHAPRTNWVAFQPYSAKAMTQQLTSFFDHVLARPRRVLS